MATLIWEWYKNLSKFRQKLTKPVDASDKRIIKRRLDELNALTRWIIGDLIEEVSQLIQKREPRWKIS